MVEPNVGAVLVIFVIAIIGFIKFLTLLPNEHFDNKNSYIKGSEVKFCTNKKY